MPTIIRDMIDQSSVHDTVNGIEFHRITFVDQIYVNDAVNPYDFYPDVLATAGLFFIRGKGIWGLAKRGFLAWRIWQTFSKKLVALRGHT